jgi:hypothetical protein
MEVCVAVKWDNSSNEAPLVLHAEYAVAVQ